MSTENEAEYKEQLAKEGVDVPEEEKKEEDTEEESKEESKEESTEESQKDESKEADKKDTEEESTETLKEEPKEPRKRSIYDDYKGKKAELKSEVALREKAESERDELQVKLTALSTAETPKEKEDAKDELTAFATKIGADPEAIKEMRALFLKDFTGGLSEEDKQALQEMREFKAENQSGLDKQRFEDEFKAVTPTLKEMFPKASEKEMEALKSKIDEVSHTKLYASQDLDYVVFKEKKALTALISPKKKGLEAKGNTDVEEESTDFDPNADYSKLSTEGKAKWEEGYKKATAQDEGLSDDGSGGKVIL